MLLFILFNFIINSLKTSPHIIYTCSSWLSHLPEFDHLCVLNLLQGVPLTLSQDPFSEFHASHFTLCRAFTYQTLAWGFPGVLFQGFHLQISGHGIPHSPLFSTALHHWMAGDPSGFPVCKTGPTAYPGTGWSGRHRHAALFSSLTSFSCLFNSSDVCRHVTSQTTQFLSQRVYTLTNNSTGTTCHSALTGFVPVGKIWPFPALTGENMQLFSIPAEPPGSTTLQGQHIEFVAWLQLHRTFGWNLGCTYTSPYIDIAMALCFSNCFRKC